MQATPPKSEEPRSSAPPEKTVSGEPDRENFCPDISEQKLLSDVDKLPLDSPLMQQILQRLQARQTPQPTPEVSSPGSGSAGNLKEVKVKSENDEASSEVGVRVKTEETASPSSLAITLKEEPSIQCKQEATDQDTSSLTSKSENEGDSTDEFSDATDEDDPDWEKQKPKTRKANSKKKARRAPAKDPREWVARKHEAEATKKRKRGEDSDDSLKARKKGKELLKNIGGENDYAPDINLSAMPDIQASTHKEQTALLRQLMPDTRHSHDQARELKEARPTFGYKQVKAEDGKCRLKGMKTGLYPYQIVASGWMVQRELDKEPPYGGIVADAPGFGKTVISLNTIMGNPPSPEDREEFSRATLIIVPSHQVATQWSNEIEKHCFYTPRRPSAVYSSSGIWNMIKCKRQWILIATYRDLNAQYPKKDKIEKMRAETMGDEEAFEKAKGKAMGLLYRVNWYRVILDEAHAIKNRNGQAARNVWELKSKFRWALTGTPLSNGADEIYPYLKFLECKFTGDHRSFIEMYCPDGSTGANFDALIGKIMMRRTLKDEFMGHRILKLEASETYDLWIPLSQEERAIYDVVDVHYERKAADLEYRNGDEDEENIEEAQYRTEPDDDKEENEEGEEQKQTGYKNVEEEKEEDFELVSSRYQLMRTRFQRLRQAVSHPFNLEKCLRTVVCKEDIRKLRITLDDIEPVSIIKQLQTSENFEEGLSKYSEGLQQVESINVEAKASEFGGHFEMQGCLALIENERRLNGVECKICDKSPDTPMKSGNCEHIYCSGCITRQVRICKNKNHEERQCHHENCPEVLDFGEHLETLDSIRAAAKIDRFKEPGVDYNLVRLSCKPQVSSLYLASSRDKTGITLPPSSKLTAAMAVIMAWRKEAPDDKIIVFHQFIMTAQVLGRMLEQAGIGFVYFNGEVKGNVRKAKALENFKEEDEVKVLLASLACGGQSLNIHEANRVIILDPWWNKTQEQQAFGRVFRTGQKKKTYLVRILAKGGIDEQIAELQRGKSEIIDRALQDDEHTLQKLTEKELSALFSPKEDE